MEPVRERGFQMERYSVAYFAETGTAKEAAAHTDTRFSGVNLKKYRQKYRHFSK